MRGTLAIAFFTCFLLDRIATTLECQNTSFRLALLPRLLRRITINYHASMTEEDWRHVQSSRVGPPTCK